VSNGFSGNKIASIINNSRNLCAGKKVKPNTVTRAITEMSRKYVGEARWGDLPRNRSGHLTERIFEPMNELRPQPADPEAALFDIQVLDFIGGIPMEHWPQGLGSGPFTQTLIHLSREPQMASVITMGNLPDVAKLIGYGDHKVVADTDWLDAAMNKK
jgi:hypothetical protein